MVECQQQFYVSSDVSHYVNSHFDSSTLIMVCYFRCFTSLLETAIETLYNGNIENSNLPPTQPLVLAWESFNWKVEARYNDLSSGGQTISFLELGNSFLVMDECVANRVLITIYYYRLRITSNFPLISHFLVLVTTHTDARGFETQKLRQKLHQIIQNDREALHELQNVFHAISAAHESFLTKFACWYTCNYTSNSLPDASEIIKSAYTYY